MHSYCLTLPPLPIPTEDIMDHMEPTNVVWRGIDAPSSIDVVNGRGQGVHKHPGNEKYRMLVSMHKGIYAQCPKQDKAKVSKGIVAAIRQFGGRFLEYDEQNECYYDIGDQKAYAKTSQALRENQPQIRRSLYKNQSHQSEHEVGLIGRTSLCAEGYFGYSFQVLESLYEGAK